MGKGTRPVLGGGRNCPLSFLIAVPIAVMQYHTKTMTDIFDRPMRRGQRERATSADSHSPGIGPDFGPRRHHRTHHIPGLKPFDLFGPFGLSAWKAPFIHETLLPTAMAVGAAQQWDDCLDLQRFWGT